MTGEMYSVDPAEWPVHKAIADALGGELKPFDQYQGPYVLIGQDALVGSKPYQVALPGPCRLWVMLGTVWREDTRQESEPFLSWDIGGAVEAARNLMEGKRGCHECGEVVPISEWDKHAPTPDGITPCFWQAVLK